MYYYAPKFSLIIFVNGWMAFLYDHMVEKVDLFHSIPVCLIISEKSVGKCFVSHKQQVRASSSCNDDDGHYHEH